MAADQSQSQYAAVAHIPLIKSPAVRVPPPLELPPDIHPLPDSVTPYFAYPFVLEPHILTLESSRRHTLAAHVARREALLQSREDEKERRRREALRRVAPGFDGHGTPLEPEPVAQRHGGAAAAASSSDEDRDAASPGHVMQNLVDELEKMEMVAGSAARTMTMTTQ